MTRAVAEEKGSGSGAPFVGDHSMRLRKPLRVLALPLIVLVNASEGFAQSVAGPEQPRDVDPPAVVRSVEIDESVFAGGVSDPDELERRQVRTLNRQIRAQLAGADARAAMAQREYDKAVANARADRQAYEAALGRYEKAIEERRRAVAAHDPSGKKK